MLYVKQTLLAADLATSKEDKLHWDFAAQF